MDCEFFEQTITYRIDSSLGLELIMESYCFFSFLFERDQATLLAEYEFNFVNKTPDNALVFSSKTDPGIPTTLLFEEAGANDIELLAREVSTNLNVIADDFAKYSQSMRVVYQNRDVALYVVMDNVRRLFTINSAARKSNILIKQNIDFSSPFVLKGDSLILDERFSATILNNNISIKSIKLSDLTEGTIAACAEPTTIHAYDGVTSANDIVKLETTLVDPSGADFVNEGDWYVGPLGLILNNGVQAGQQVVDDITGAQQMQLYYNYDIGSGTPFYGLGFFIQNSNGTNTFALREFVPTIINNRIIFDFAPEISIFGEQNTDANIDNVNIYLEAMTEGDNTYVFKAAENVYEFFNPCTGWTFVFGNANQ